MTTYTLMSAQTVPSNATNGPAPNPVVIAGNPTRAQCVFSLNQASKFYSQATIWGQTGIGTVPYSTQIVPLIVMVIPPGFTATNQAVPLDYPYQNVFARLDDIDPSQSVAATMTMST